MVKAHQQGFIGGLEWALSYSHLIGNEITLEEYLQLLQSKQEEIESEL